MSLSVLPIKKKAPVWEKDPKDRHLWKHLPSGVYYVRKKRKGKKPLFKSTGETGKGKAKTRAEAMIAAWLGDRPITYRDAVLFGEFAAQYLKLIEQSTKYRDRTKEQARIYITQLIDEVGLISLAEINEGFFEEWITELRHKKKRTTFGDYAKYLSKVMRHAHAKGLIARMPKFKNPDKPKVTGRVFTHKEIEALYWVSACDSMRLQVRLALQCFMRLREMLGLTWDRVDFETGRITLEAKDVKTGSKTGRGRTFIVNRVVLSMLRVQFSDTGHTSFVFPSGGKTHQWSNKTAWKSMKKRAGIRGRARWHDLRHTALTWALAEKKMNPLLVGQYAGTSVRTIEKVYLKVTPEHTAEVGECIDIF